MSMNYKNILQEHYQKRGLNLPQYDTYRKGGSSHNPIFSSKVILHYGETFNGSGPNKKKAEQDCAKKALFELNIINDELTNNNVTSTAYHVSFTCSTVILLDLENIASEVDKYNNLYSDNAIIFGFVSSSHPISSIKTNTIHLIVVDSDASDAADIALAVKFGQFLTTKDYERYIIITSDHFAESLPVIANSANYKYQFKPDDIKSDNIKIDVVKYWGQFIELEGMKINIIK